MIDLHGLELEYRSKINSVYDVETGSTTETINSFYVNMYPKNIQANQMHYPSLIGKTVCMFYVLANPLFTPKLQDVVIYNSSEYTIDSIQSHVASGSLVLYRLIGVK